MEFVHGPKPVDVEPPSDRLQMYRIPPIQKISLVEFENVATERLKVLRDVETFGIRNKKDSSEYAKKMEEAVKKFWKHSYITNVTHKRDPQYHKNVRDELCKDNTSHFILRLAYCRSDELRRWFIAQENDLFKFRFVLEAENFKRIQTFLEANNLEYSPIPDKEKNKRKDNLAASDYKMTIANVKKTHFYKVPFTEVLDLVRSRKVFLEKGYAYVAKENLVSIIGNCFRTNLSRELAITSRALPYLEEDERLLPSLDNLSQQYLGQVFGKKALTGDKITVGQIDSASKVSFPLCMRQLHEALRRDHHLKNGGRIQYGLFIKGIGLTLEESLLFWRSEFTRIMEVDKFDKQYAYNIRHNYGKEGKRADYTPFSCMKIILNNNPGHGDYHGCPFRHSDAGILREQLVRYGVPKPGIDEILKLVKESHYQLACARYFEVTHKVSLSHQEAVNHPNKYFEESRRVHKELSTGNLKEEPLAHTSIDHISHGAGVKTEQITPRSTQKLSTADMSEPASKSHDPFDIEMDDIDDDALANMEY